MIGKGKSIAHISQAVDYALKKDKAEVLEMKGVFATNGKEIETQFDAIGANSERLKNKGMSFVLSPTPDDGSALSDAKYREITEEFTKKKVSMFFKVISLRSWEELKKLSEVGYKSIPK